MRLSLRRNARDRAGVRLSALPVLVACLALVRGRGFLSARASPVSNHHLPSPRAARGDSPRPDEFCLGAALSCVATCRAPPEQKSRRQPCLPSRKDREPVATRSWGFARCRENRGENGGRHRGWFGGSSCFGMGVLLEGSNGGQRLLFQVSKRAQDRIPLRPGTFAPCPR